MLNNKPTAPEQFAADTINAVKTSLIALTEWPDGRKRDLTSEQATAITQVMALNAVAAGLLAVANAISSHNKP